MSIIDHVLSLPDHIDFYVYTPGSGGEFFASLIALSHKKTREILKFKSFDALKNNEDLIRYNRPQYFTYDNDFKFLNLNIDNEFYNSTDLFQMIGHLMSPLDRINYSKMLLFQSMIDFNIKFGNSILLTGTDTLNDISIYKGANIILCTHWVDLSAIPKTKNFESRNFGLNLFENEKYWDVINLDPKTEKGKNLVLNFCKKFKLVNNIEKIKTGLNHSAFNNIKLQFPFMDYLAINDFDSIKNYISNRYGPDLDFDFIDQALIDYKKIRVDPYL
jgi:hypothetical protein